MVMDDQNPLRHPPLFAPRRAQARRTAALALVAGILCGLAFWTFGLFRTPPAATASPGDPPAPAKPASRLFTAWPMTPKPAFVLLLSAQEYGYLQPCGCSHPQLGGLERRYNLIRGLMKEKGWSIVSLDLGDIAQHSGAQALLKYKTSMEGLHWMGYLAAGIGRNETNFPLLSALAEWTLDNPTVPRILCANLQNREVNFPGMVSPVEVAGTVPRLGVVGVVAPSVSKEIRDPSVTFDPVNAALENILKNDKRIQETKPQFLVLLFQGSADEAKLVAAKFPQFQVILCLSAEEEPSGRPDMVGNTMIVSVGHKGRYVGLVGVYPTGKANKPYDLHYQLVALGEEYETPPGRDADNPILTLLEKYSKEVKDRDYLAHYPQTLHPVQRAYPDATYVGSEKCKKCHEHAYEVWKASPHAHAYHDLVEAKRPSLRQFDGECVGCHVTGFGYNGGFTDEQKTPLLKDNGCENCHGPCSVHVKGDKSPKMLALINPLKTPPKETDAQKQQRMNRLDLSCQKCHDIDNDVHWKLDKWVKGHIEHMTPADEK